MKYARKTLLATAAAAVMSIGQFAGAAIVTTSVTTDNGSGADAYINTGSASLEDTNFGNSTLLAVKLATSGTYNLQTVNRKAYIRFDISGFDLSATPNAILTLYAADVSGGTATVQVYGLNDAHAGESWVEGDGGTGNSPVNEIDFDNAPANQGTAQTSNTFEAASSTLLGSFSAAPAVAGTAYTFSSAALNSFLLADTNGLVTLMFLRTTANTGINTTFASKEHATINPPTLQFDVVVIPTPSALPAGLAVLGLAAVRRRRRSI